MLEISVVNYRFSGFLEYRCASTDNLVSVYIYMIILFEPKANHLKSIVHVCNVGVVIV